MSPRFSYNRRIHCVELKGTAEIVILEFVPVADFSMDELGEAITGARYRTEDGHRAVYAQGMRAFVVAGHGKIYRPIGRFVPL